MQDPGRKAQKTTQTAANAADSARKKAAKMRRTSCGTAENMLYYFA